MSATMKVCTCCGATLPLGAFYRDLRNRDGLYSECKPCTAARRKRDRSRARQAERRYTARNPERRRATWRESQRRTRARQANN